MIIDLTQSLEVGIPDWDGCCGFRMTGQQFGDICVQSIATPSGIGTHMDAPCHFIKGAADIASIPVEQLMVPAVVIDVRDKAHPDYLLNVQEIIEFEKKHGTIPTDSVVLLLTGWSQYWHNPLQYRNVDVNEIRRFPCFSIEAAEYLLTRNIVGIGIDTLSPDTGKNGFPVHEAILGKGRYILENLCNLEKLPPIGTKLIALPIKMKGGAEAPARVIGITP